MFILCTEVIIEHMFVGFIQNMVVFIKNYTKSDYPHHVIIKHRAMCRTCRWNNKGSTVMSYPLKNRVHDVIVLALLSLRHIRYLARCLIILSHGKDNQILCNFMTNATMA